MDVDVNIGGITKDATDEASRIDVAEATKAVDEGAAKDTAEEAAKGTTEATGSILALGAPSAIMAMQAKVVDEKTTITINHPSPSEAPLSSKYLKVGDFQFISVPGTSSIEAYIGEEVLDSEVTTTTFEVVEGEYDQSSKAIEHSILLAMNENFKKL
jgi:hypothetical protein